MLKSAADATQLLFQETGFYEVLALLKNQRIQVTYRFHSTPAQPSVRDLGKSVRFRKISPGDSKNQSTEWVYGESVSSEYNEKSDMKPSIASDLLSETTARRQRQ